MNVVQVIGDVLQQSGTRELFGVLGAGNLAFVGHAVEQHGMRYHALRHESAAVAAADTFARVTGDVAVATVTHGPGLTHASSAIVEAVKSAVPLLIITSAVSRSAPHQNQALDQAAVVRSLGAMPIVLIDAADTYRLTQQALTHARSQTQPTVLIVPDDLHDQEVEASGTTVAVERARPEVSAKAVELSRAARILMEAARPIIVAGRGATQPGTIRALRDIGNQVGALLFTTLPAKDCFSDDDYNAGICGSFGSKSLVDLASNADAVLVVGSSMSSWTTQCGQLFSRAAIIRSDIDNAASGRGEAVFLRGDAATVVTNLLSLIRPARRNGYRNAESEAILRAARAEVFPDRSDNTGLDPRVVVRDIANRLPPERSIVIDGGHFSGWPAMIVPTPPPGVFVYAHGYQCVGLALGNVVGIAVAAPNNLPIAFVGDGGLLMSLGELHAVGDLNIPVLVVVLNDGAYGAEYHQAHPCHAPLTTLRRQNFAGVARALGGTGILVKRLSDLDELSAWLEAPRGLCLVDCHVTRGVKASWLPDNHSIPNNSPADKESAHGA